jgi:hypothetical protein
MALRVRISDQGRMALFLGLPSDSRHHRWDLERQDKTIIHRIVRIHDKTETPLWETLDSHPGSRPDEPLELSVHLMPNRIQIRRGGKFLVEILEPDLATERPLWRLERGPLILEALTISPDSKSISKNN